MSFIAANHAATPSAPLLFRHARLIQPVALTDMAEELIGDVLVADGVIQQIAPQINVENHPDIHIIDCHGHALAPALIDGFALCPEPGEEYTSFQQLSEQAIAGGVGTVLVAPEASPMRDLVANLRFAYYRAQDTALCRLLFHGALTRGLAGQELADMGRLQQAGAMSACQGMQPVASTKVMHRAMTHAAGLDILITHRPEDAELAQAGMVHHGMMASRLGLPAIPAEAETIGLARDMQLQAATGARYHALMLSCAESVALLHSTMRLDMPISASVSIANLLFTDMWLEGFNTQAKTIPPCEANMIVWHCGKPCEKG